MVTDDARARKLLRDFNFPALFVEELGWDKHKATLSIPIADKTFELAAVAEKRGMAAFVCECDGALPDYNARRKIERQVAKSAHEHFIIFIDASKTRQIWQWVKREAGKPDACREHHLDRAQSGEALIQKLKNVAFELAEEENITLVDVTIRARAGFDVEKVTKRFYDRFQKEHAAFLKFIKGIPDDQLQRWYASVMLNRLMFIYFIQKKGFLDNDINYLRNKLAARKPKDRYFSDFLCPLFFEGFAKKADDRSEPINQLLGRVPYLNGGLFLRHQIEELHGESIRIPDTAFERIFDFFDAYQWHLDERPLRGDNEINPDVLGYIFEKYINAIQPGEQKAKGAYYSREDITDYIGKNTVLPFLFDAARPKCKIAFENPNGPTIWDLLKADPDRYVYPAVRHSVSWNYIPDHPQKGEPIAKPLVLPTEIAPGLKDVSKRNSWNKAAPAEFALPTEIWREVVARRQRCDEIRKKLEAGEVRDINELVTLNINVRQFAQDVIQNCEGPELLRAFWNAVQHITILDPTCGSGAFLFAALNILEPLYEACLDRMEVFLADEAAKHEGANLKFTERGYPLLPHRKFEDFSLLLDRVAEHPKRRYFIFKTIILNSLFGVDIMGEAIEICKLRLFLKLAAQVEPDSTKDNLGIEPLPDIDFNIRVGNTLVGYATAEEVKRSMQEFGSGQMRLGVEDELKSYVRFCERVEDVDRQFKLFREMQTERGMDAKKFIKAKETLRERLKTVEDELNRYLASDYGVNVTDKGAFTRWLKSHQPFHWFVEFYGIMSTGGFDVVIGNPPYVEYEDIVSQYRVKGYETEASGDLYAFCFERSIRLAASGGFVGMIVPVSIASTDGFHTLRTFIQTSCALRWSSHYAERPSKLFTGAEKRLTIWISKTGGKNGALNSTRYHRWVTEERPTLFDLLNYQSIDPGLLLVNSAIPKIGNRYGAAVLKKISQQPKLARFLPKLGGEVVYYTRKLRYFIQFLDFVPKIYNERGKMIPPSELKELRLEDRASRDAALATLNSTLFFFFFSSFSDVRNVNRREIEQFPVNLDALVASMDKRMSQLRSRLMRSLDKNSRFLTGDYKEYGVLKIQSFQPRLSKHEIDVIDEALAEHFGFSREELDFIINYDIKYRMGLGGEDAEDRAS